MEARNTRISRLILLMVTAALPLLFVACGNTGSSSSGGSQVFYRIFSRDLEEIGASRIIATPAIVFGRLCLVAQGH